MEQVLDAVGCRGWITGGLVASSDDNTFLGAPSGKDDGLAHGPVVTPGVLVDARRAPHLAHHNDECLIQQSPLFEVFYQGAEGLVGRWNERFLMTREVVDMGIPTAVGNPDEASPCLD